MTQRERHGFAAWLIGVLVVAVLLGRLLWQGLPLQTDLLAMLPANEQDPLAQAASRQLDAVLGERSVLLVGAGDAETAIAAAGRAAAELRASKAFSDVRLQRPQLDALASALQFRFALSDPDRVLPPGPQGLQGALDEVAAQLYGPLGAPRAALLSRDPLFLAGDLLQRRMVPGMDMDRGVLLLHGEQRVWALIEARNASRAFVDHGDGPAPVAAAIARARAAAAAPGVEVLASSIALHSGLASRTAKDEISRIGIGSWIGAILLMWLAFRRVSAIVLCLLPLAVATAVALLVTVTLMGSLHVLTLVFGASLIGVAIDYGTHCFADSLGADEHWSMSHAVQQLRPALTYGMLTSVTGYLALALAPFPGLREIAVFSSAGLLAAFLTVVLAFPVLLRHYRPDTRGMWLAAFIDGVYRRMGSWVSWRRLLPLLLLLLGGLWQLRASDDIRSFYARDPQLAQQDDRIRALFGQAPETQFYLVQGRSAAEVLQREQRLLQALQPMLAAGQLGHVRALSQLLPDPASQQVHLQRWQQRLADPAYTNWLRGLGIPEEAIAADAAALASARPVSPSGWLASPLGQADRVLWLDGQAAGKASLVLLSGIRDRAALADLPARAGLSGVQWVDRTADVSGLMARSRNLALALTAAAIVVMLLLMVPRHGWRGATWIILPSVFSAAGALALFGWLGLPLNIFSAFALLLVLALGVDYAIFFRESGEDSHQAMLGVALDSSTTVLSFGLLALSSLPAARSFGTMVLFGIMLAFLLAPLARPQPGRTA
ncbi:MMPL family transporter [Chitinilyticum piscinae]|uniref:Membrane transport protein MMPL domain-containing protein n=1 Tax=Chitinilyticum piscinae TaxID=2866724 RepID=A0A8J7FHF9_9NEIS|nr:hypothetical protein [Chitinilyticum piscinae]MBE9607817.1 hypothetical protein [Chitinilyticum piscinae]